MEEIKEDFQADLGLEGEQLPALDLLVEGESRYIKDLRLNVKKVLKEDALNEKEIVLLGLALGANNKNERIFQFFLRKAKSLEIEEELIAEAIACASLLASNNVLYRFRHFVGKEQYQMKAAGIRMNIMMKPKMGKEMFELISLAVSAVNGCEACVKSHEQSVLEAGSSEDRVWQAIRMASVIESLDRMI